MDRGSQAAKINAGYLLLKKMTEKTIPSPNPAPVRRNAAGEDKDKAKSWKMIQFSTVSLDSNSGISDYASAATCNFSTPNQRVLT